VLAIGVNLAAQRAHKNLVHLLVLIAVLLPSALNIKILLILFIGQIKTGPVGHMHFEGAGRKTLSLLLVDAGDLLLRVTHRPVVLRWVLLH
jgi:hypothetical protein